MTLREAGEVGRSASTQRSFSPTGSGHKYGLESLVSAGHHGQIYRAVLLEDLSRDPDEHAASATTPARGFVLKRLLNKPGAKLSGLREIFFGNRLRGSPLFAQFVEGWAAEGSDDLFLVFADEGVSLQSLLFDFRAASPLAPGQGGSLLMADGSVFFGRLHQQPHAGAAVVRSIMRQLLRGLEHMHQRRYLHRDVKPANLLVNVAGDGHGLHVKLCDLGSAVAFDAPDLYHQDGKASSSMPFGPSQLEETLEYAPPEVRLHATLPFHPLHPFSYDLWSAGIVFLEMLFGLPSPSLFTVSGKQEAILSAKVQAGVLTEEGAAHERYLASLQRLCLYSPEAVDQEAAGDEDPTSDGSGGSCSLRDFRASLRRLLWKRHYEVRSAKKTKLAAEEKAITDRTAMATTSEAKQLATNPVSHSASQGLPAATRALSLLQESESGLSSFGSLSPDLLALPPSSSVQTSDFAVASFSHDGTQRLSLPRPVLDPGSAQSAALVLRRRREDRDESMATLFDSLAVTLTSGGGTAAPWQGFFEGQSLPAPDGSTPGVSQGDVALAAESSEWMDSELCFSLENTDTEGGHDGVGYNAACTISRPSPLLGEAGEELLWRMLAFDPAARITAEAALRLHYFKDSAPIVTDDSSASDTDGL